LPISFGGKPKEEDVVSLIAAKKYARAIEVLKAQLSKKGANPSLRMQLADVLLLAEKKNEAIALLLPLADQYANEGFAAKAVSVLKKVQKIDPGRRDVDSRLARLIQEKQREAVVLPPSRSAAPLVGMEEIDDGPGLEIGFSMGPISVSAPSAPAEPPAPVAVAVTPEPVAPEPVAPEPVLEAEPVAGFAPEPLPSLAPEPLPLLEAEPVVVQPEPVPVLEVEPLPLLEAEPVVEASPVVPEAGVEDYDLLYAGDDDEEEALPLAAEALEAEPDEGMSAGQFADELMSLVDSVFQESPALGATTAAKAPAAAAASAAPPRSGTQIVVSPLFRDFSVDEMVAVIEGLKLLTFQRGDVILREGAPGASLYMLTSGAARAFRKDEASGRQLPLGDIKEGAFFGEVSILTGQPRTASVVALSRCELLELDRPTLDQITGTHPHVWDVLREFAGKRAARPR
jgi:tetratricopeptide (TPR) repeat protein